MQVASEDDCPPNWCIIQRLQEPELADIEPEHISCSGDDVAQQEHSNEPASSAGKPKPLVLDVIPESAPNPGRLSTAPLQADQDSQVPASVSAPSRATYRPQNLSASIPPCSWAARSAPQSQKRVRSSQCLCCAAAFSVFKSVVTS